MALLIPIKPHFDALEGNYAILHKDQFKQKRQSLMTELRCLTGLPKFVHTLNPDTLYKIVVPEGTLLQQGKDGLYRGVFYNEQGIERHAKFVRQPQGLLTVAKAIGTQVLLISIAMQLNDIEKMVEKLFMEMHRDRIAEIDSGVTQLELSMFILNIDSRRGTILNTIQTLHTGLEKTICELKNRIKEAPSPTKKFHEHLNPRVNKLKKADEILRPAEESFYAALRGIKSLANCYTILGEFDAARKVLSIYFDKVISCNISDAAEKARLLSFSRGIAPQEPWEKFIVVYNSMQEYPESFWAHELDEKDSAFEIEFMPAELQGGINAKVP